jgi:uncharacterized lipoprotein YddW (UPF0748 family)
MFSRVIGIVASGRWIIVTSILFSLAASSAEARTNEIRGLWADAWGGNYTTSEKCSQLVADLRSGNFNSLILQARRRGDALYNSHYEPKISELRSQSFDPLGDVIAKAHDTSDGKQRIDVHAWLVTYHVWRGGRPPSQPDHPYNLHRDWLMKDNKGETFLEGQYTFDPGHPDVQRHTFNVCMDIITNYAVDGIHFDYIRYGATSHGYHDVSVARFNRLNNRTGKPEPEDPVWKQFRRDQVTALVRKVYLCGIAARPEVKISASTIAWSPGVTSDLDWTNRARAYNSVLQDWRSWMEEGILDLNVPMTYFRHHQASSATDYYNFCEFVADHRFNRQAIVGPGIYLNTLSNALHQFRYTQRTTAKGNQLDGLCGYAYRETNNERLPSSKFLNALVQTSDYDPVTPPIFAEKASIPVMPWKTAPTMGHLKGFIYGETPTQTLDGATITLNGPIKRKITSDATGFFGSVDVPPGNYSLSANFTDYSLLETNVTIVAGKVATSDLVLAKAVPAKANKVGE